jgi:hypothetical protein
MYLSYSAECLEYDKHSKETLTPTNMKLENTLIHIFNKSHSDFGKY